MLEAIDEFTDGITMYRLIIYYLLVLFAISLALSIFGLLQMTAASLIFSLFTVVVSCWLANLVFSSFLKVTVNLESWIITALILVLIITPTISVSGVLLLIFSSIWAIASKFVLNIKNKHIFNPAAFGVVMTGLLINQPASWWVGTSYLLPFVFVGGVIITRKIRRFDLVLPFFAATILMTCVYAAVLGHSIYSDAMQVLLDTPMFFLGFVMLTDPITTPPSRRSRTWYGAIVGVLFSPIAMLSSLSFTPELALVCGNIYSYLASYRTRLVLNLKEKVRIATDTYDFIFRSPQPLNFAAGQYMEWTLPVKDNDDRGNRRYFTIASSPNNADIRIGVKFSSPSSAFKKEMEGLGNGDEIIASQLAGDFILPPEKDKKLVFIAGGIGITPFRSMIEYLLDQNEKRDIVLIYANKTEKDIAYQNFLNEAAAKLRIKVVYVLSKPEPGWKGKTGRINNQIIADEIPDYKERTFYISGSQAIIQSCTRILVDLHLDIGNIKTDYFPGFT